jgi:hypothetical protein
VNGLVCSDLKPRAKDEAVQAVLDHFAELTAQRTDLTGLCVERGNTEDELRAGVCRCVEDARTCRHLIEAGASGGLILSAAEIVADVWFSRMREAGELDRLFLGRYRASWEERLFESRYGRTYVASCVLPAVERSYSVPLTQRPETDPLRVILETCPTAARLVRAYAPPPSNLVKESLLAHAALTGALFDLHADPERLLAPRLRAALQALAGPNPAIAPTLRLLEEMALVGGFTAEQVQEAQTISEAAHQVLDEMMPADQPVIQICLTQTLPGNTPAATTHLHRLLLAGRRAGTPIFLTNAPDQPLALQVTPEAALPAPVTDGFVLGVGPSAPLPGGTFRLPARIEVSRPSRTVRFYLGRFGTAGPTPYPVVVTLPTPPRPGERPTVGFGAFIQWPELTVRDLRLLDAANQVIRGEGGAVELLVEDNRALLASMSTHGGSELFRLGRWTTEVFRGFRGLDGNLPAPLLIPVQRIAELGCLSASDRDAAWRQLRETPLDGPRRVCSLFLRTTTDTGKPIEERFLRFFPFNLFPAPPIEENETISAEEFTRRWEAGNEDFLLTAYLQSDVHDLSQALRDWCRSPSGEFPFRFEPSAVDSPVTRSVLSIRFPRTRDRGWHLDRAIIFEFRPVNRAEAYQLEATYWRSVNDDRRAELAEEIRARLANA